MVKINSSMTKKELKEALKEIGVTDTFGTGREVAKLPEVIREDEEIIYATSGLIDKDGVMDLFGVRDSSGATVLVVLTDSRIVFIDKGLLWGLKVAEIPLDAIVSITNIKGLFFGKIKITHGSRCFIIQHITKVDAPIIADKTMEQMKIVKNGPSSMHDNSTTKKSPVEQVKELKELLDMEIITADEFNKKRNELLGL